MDFFGREKEIEILRRERKLSLENSPDLSDCSPLKTCSFQLGYEMLAEIAEADVVLA